VTLLVLVLYFLAVMRVTRLINFDTIMDWLHSWAGERFGPGSWQAEFLQCPWCVGMWVGGLTAWFPIKILIEIDGRLLWWWMYPLIALAGSMVIGLFAPLSAEDTDFEPTEPPA
jgi:hypothetical protein